MTEGEGLAVDRVEAHRRLDALLDRIEQLDAKNDDAGRFEAAGQIVQEFALFARDVGVGPLLRQRFTATAFGVIEGRPAGDYARGVANCDDLTPKTLDAGNDDPLNVLWTRAAQAGWARAAVDWLRPLLPEGAGALLAASLYSLAEGEDPMALRSVWRSKRGVPAPTSLAAIKGKMVLRAHMEAARDGGSAEGILAARLRQATGKQSDSAARKWNREVPDADRERARAIGKARAKGEPVPADLAELASQIDPHDWPGLIAGWLIARNPERAGEGGSSGRGNAPPRG